MVAKQIAREQIASIACGETVCESDCESKNEMSGKSQVVELIAATIDHLVFIDPNIAFAS